MAISNNPALKPGQMPSTQRTAMPPAQKKTLPAKEAVPTDTADDVTQQGLETAQRSLNAQPADAVDTDRVAQMQALIASGEFTLDTDQIAASMLSFFTS